MTGSFKQKDDPEPPDEADVLRPDLELANRVLTDLRQELRSGANPTKAVSRAQQVWLKQKQPLAQWARRLLGE